MFPSNIHSLFKKGYIQVIFDKSDNVGYSITPLGEEKIKRNYE
jgi:DNA-binding PadR family transcriptional regulator